MTERAKTAAEHNLKKRMLAPEVSKRLKKKCKISRPFMIQFRIDKNDKSRFRDSYWPEPFEWHKWDCYAEKKDAEMAIASLKRRHEGFEYRLIKLEE